MDELFSETVSFSSTEQAASLLNPPEPKTIGSGIVTSILGKGGAAVIYEIWNPKLEIYRAVKLWRPILSDRIVKRFETEMKITAKLRHPNIVEIHGVGEWNGLPFIEIEKIDGYSLKEVLLTKEDGLPVPVATAIAISVCRALNYAHNSEYSLSGKKFKGVIHCDIKPANIMISKDGNVKLTDFGIALPSNTLDISEKNKITGSLQYMAPEQLASSGVDVRTDIFSLGVVLYEIFSGEKTFSAPSMEVLIEKRKNHHFDHIDKICKGLSSRVINIIKKCIEVDPDNRYQSVTELMLDLEKVYYKYSNYYPDKIIRSYFEDDTVLSREPAFYKYVKPLYVIIILVVTALSAIFFVKMNQNSDKFNKLDIEEKDIEGQNKKDGVIINDKKDSELNNSSIPKETTSNKVNKPIEKKSKGKSNSSDKKNTASQKDELLSDDAVIDKLWKLIRGNDLKNADRIFSEYSINDAEYYLAKSEYQIKKGNYTQAKLQLQKAMQTQSRRMNVYQIRDKMFYLKAKALSGEYNKAYSDHDKGQTAMEAWYDVKYQYRSDSKNQYYIEADKEIRRISSELKK